MPRERAWPLLLVLSLALACSHAPTSGDRAAEPAGLPECAVRSGRNSGWQPLVVLAEIGSMGGENQTLVVYEGGELLIREVDGSLRRRLVEASELEQLIHGLELDRLRSLEPGYQTSFAEHDTRTVLAWRDGQTLRAIDVYGPVAAQPSRSDAPGEGYIHKGPVPAPLYRTVERLRSFRDTLEASAWRPEVVELELYGHEGAAKALADWPANWPGLDSRGARMPEVRALPAPGMPGLTEYIPGRIEIDGSCLEQALELRQRTRPPEAFVLLAGRAYWFRVVPLLPLEEEWRHLVRKY